MIVQIRSRDFGILSEKRTIAPFPLSRCMTRSATAYPHFLQSHQARKSAYMLKVRTIKGLVLTQVNSGILRSTIFFGARPVR